MDDFTPSLDTEGLASRSERQVFRRVFFVGRLRVLDTVEQVSFLTGCDISQRTNLQPNLATNNTTNSNLIHIQKQNTKE